MSSNLFSLSANFILVKEKSLMETVRLFEVLSEGPDTPWHDCAFLVSRQGTNFLAICSIFSACIKMFIVSQIDFNFIIQVTNRDKFVAINKFFHFHHIFFYFAHGSTS
jgi:hypothetical protein